MDRKKRPGFIDSFIEKTAGEQIDKQYSKIEDRRKKLNKSEQAYKEKKMQLTEEFERHMEALNVKLEELKSLGDKMDFYGHSFLDKMRNYGEYKKTIISIVEVSEEKEQMSLQIENLRTQIEQLQKTSIDYTEIDVMEHELESFIARQEDAWKDTPYEREDIERDMNTEHLKSLSLEEYILLMQRYPQDMVTHVTRQGVRDHTGFFYHTAGLDEKHDGFKELLEDKTIHSVVGLLVAKNGKEYAIREYIDLDSATTREEAEQNLREKMGDEETTGKFGDYSAVHFAASEVADRFYGAESGNEIFVAYPSAYIASQFNFHGLLNNKEGGQNNDLYVWQRDVQGMDVDAGIVFISKDAHVDRETGSQYVIENGKGIPDSEAQSMLEEVVKSDAFFEHIDKLIELTWPPDRDKYILEKDIQKRMEDAQNIIASIGESLDDFRSDLSGVLLNYRVLGHIKGSLNYCKFLRNGGDDQIAENHFNQHIRIDINSLLRDAGKSLVRSEDTVSSREYWEQYFDKNPEKRPSKIVYYEGNDPTTALNNFLSKNGLHKQHKKKTEKYGFDERHMDLNKGSYVVGLDRFKAIAQDLIDKKFR